MKQQSECVALISHLSPPMLLFTLNVYMYLYTLVLLLYDLYHTVT